MATINQVISTLPEAGHRGIDARTLFVTKQEAFQDAITDTFVPQLNTFASQVNTTQSEINQVSQNTLGYRDTTKTYRDESLNNKNLALTYKTGAELAYSSTQTLLSTLVIPTAATYTYTEADNLFATELDSFIDLKI